MKTTRISVVEKSWMKSIKIGIYIYSLTLITNYSLELFGWQSGPKLYSLQVTLQKLSRPIVKKKKIDCSNRRGK